MTQETIRTLLLGEDRARRDEDAPELNGEKNLAKQGNLGCGSQEDDAQHPAERRKNLQGCAASCGTNPAQPVATTFMPSLRRERVLIGIVTSGRPRMLERCLTSLCALKIPAGLDVSIAVVSNGDPQCKIDNLDAYLRGLAEWTRRRDFYHNFERGIAKARNSVLDHGLTIACDWIAFIDDDEIADRHWIASLMLPGYDSIPVLMGLQKWRYPEPRPFWALPERQSRKRENERLKTAYTNNVRFSIALVRSGLRFNEQLGDMGGEDNEFFATAHARGFEIRQTLEAVTIETAHPERLTYRGQVYRAYWTGASNLRRLAAARGWRRAILGKLVSVPMLLTSGIVELVACVPCALAGPTMFKRRALAGGKKIAKGLGRAAAMLGIMPAPYAKVVGH